MQVKTYVYGTPLGFNFYEDDSQYKDYFKGFYISSREGRRLMVNRRDNGETSYNFLCYRINEFGNRPNAFFGMSFIIGDYEYCADFNKIYSWFDFLFEKIIEQGNIVKKTESGLQFGVSHFSDDVSATEWIKSNIPNILSQIQILKYDNSFSEAKNGRIAQFSLQENNVNVLKAFKQQRWVCLSSSYKANNDCPELAFGDLKDLINDANEQLVSIVANPEEKQVTLLKQIHNSIKENYLLITEYIKKTTDEDSKKEFSDLGQKYYDMLENNLPQIAKILQEKLGLKKTPDEERRVCTKCGREKPISAFAKGDSICLECRNSQSPKEEKKVCTKCGKEKPISSFSPGDSICIECRNRKEKDFVFPLRYIYAGLATVGIIVIVVISVWLFIRHTDPNPSTLKEDDPVVVVSPTGKVQESTYISFIGSRDYEGAYNYIHDKTDYASYVTRLKNDYEQYLLSLTSNQIRTEMITHDGLWQAIGIDQNAWNKYVADVDKINQYLTKATISKSERSVCKTLIDSYKIGIYKDKAIAWEAKLNKIPLTAETPTPIKPQTIKVVLFGSDFTKIREYEITTQRNIEVQKFGVGGYVDVYCSTAPKCISGNGVEAKKQQGTQPPYRIKPINAGEWVYQCDDAQITIKTKKFDYIP